MGGQHRRRGAKAQALDQDRREIRQGRPQVCPPPYTPPCIDRESTLPLSAFPVNGAPRSVSCCIGPYALDISKSHQTSPIVKLGDPEHFTNSHPYEAILGAIDASWGVLSRKNFRRRLKKILGKKNDPGSRVLGYPPFFFTKFYFFGPA